MPSVKPNESRDQYVSRCAGDSGMKGEFPDQKQRVAVCFSLYKKHKKKKQLKGSTAEPTWEEYKAEFEGPNHWIFLD